MHPTRPGADQQLQLRMEGPGHYLGILQPLTDGHWYIQLAADDWRLSGTLQIPQSAPLQLFPQE